MFTHEMIKSFNQLEMDVYNYIISNEEKVVYMNSVPFCFSLYSIIILCSLEAVFIPHFNRVFHYFIVFASELRNAPISGLANTFARSSESTSSATIINSRPTDS